MFVIQSFSQICKWAQFLFGIGIFLTLPKETVGRVRAVLVLVLSNDDTEVDDKKNDNFEDDEKEDEKLVRIQ